MHKGLRHLGQQDRFAAWVTGKTELSVAEELEDVGVPGCAWTTQLSILASESEKRKETLCCI